MHVGSCGPTARSSWQRAAPSQWHARFQYASREFRADREFALAVVQQNGDTLWYVSEQIRADREIVLAAVQQFGHALRYASEHSAVLMDHFKTDRLEDQHQEVLKTSRTSSLANRAGEALRS